MVKGGADELTDALKSQLIGLSLNATNFSGLLLSSKSELLSDRLVTEVPSIDEILVRISKGGNQNE